MSDKDTAETVESIFKTIAIIVGGIWIYFKFIRTRENHPKIEFNVDLNILGEQDGRLLIEVIAIIINKGQVRHWVSNFFCDVLVLKKGDRIINGGESINYQVQFENANPPKEISPSNKSPNDRIVWIPENWYKSFIDPGIEQRYTYLTSVPSNTTYISIYSRFETKRDDFHTSQRTFKVN